MLKESVFRILANRITMLDVRWSISRIGYEFLR